MKLFMYCMLLQFAAMVVTAPIRVRRENVLSFLNDALATTTEKIAPAYTTAHQNPTSKPVKEQNSEDMSEANSPESFDTNGFTGPEVSDKNGGESRDAFNDPDSEEIIRSRDVKKAKAPSRRKTNVGLMDLSSRLVQDQGSSEHIGPHLASRQRSDPNSGEGVMGGAQEAENLSGKQAISLSGVQVMGSLQRGTAAESAHGLNGMLCPGGGRQLPDWDSLEENNGRLSPVGDRGDPDYDDTREFFSAEVYPKVRPEHIPSSFSVPAQSRAS